jgi:hypothetical protein
VEYPVSPILRKLLEQGHQRKHILSQTYFQELGCQRRKRMFLNARRVHKAVWPWLFDVFGTGNLRESGVGNSEERLGEYEELKGQIIKET